MIRAGVSEEEMQAQQKSPRPAGSEGEQGRESINQLLAELHSHDFGRREGARWQLVAMREAAVPSLSDALEDPDWHVRWEAAKALGDIGDPKSATALVKALRDRRFGVRWLASDALIALKEASLPPLFEALERNGDSVLLRNGAHHVLVDLTRGHVSREVTDIIRPVLKALESMEPSIAVPFTAKKALEDLPRRIRRQAV
jgi:HEAT repeat protein